MAEISLDMWRETGRELGRGRSRNAWEIAAWYCDSPYANGVSVSAAADMVGITRASMRNFIQVWHATGGKPIHSDLTFTHHLVAIQSGNAEWRRWLDRAASEGWTVEQLAMALKPTCEVKSTEKRYGLHLTVEGENALRDLLGAYNRVAPKHVSDDQYISRMLEPVSYTHLRAHETELHLVCRLLLEKKTIREDGA